MNPPDQKNNEAFIEKLLKLKEDRGALAHLRRFWSPATLHYAYPILGRLDAIDPQKPEAIIAALFAIHPQHLLGGLTVGRAALSLGKREENHHPYDTHFRRLLASDELADASLQLLKLMRRMQRESTPVDFNQVLWDLRRWDKDAAKVKTWWAMDFWQAPAELLTETTA